MVIQRFFSSDNTMNPQLKEAMRNLLVVMTVSSVITMSRAYKNEEILFVKQGQDGISMDEFLADRNYNQTLNISNIVQKKLNYKSQLMDRIYTDQLESLNLRFLNAFGDVLFWITYLHPTVKSGFKIQSQQLTSSHSIDKSTCEIQHSSYYWQYAQDKTGIWYAIYEGFHLPNIPNYPKFMFSGSKTKGDNLVTDPFVFSDCYNISSFVPPRIKCGLQICQMLCDTKGEIHMAIGFNATCHCGQFQRYTLADIASCPVCEEIPSLRCPTERHIFAGYLLAKPPGMSAEADLHVAKQSTSLIFNARIETPTKVWQAAELTRSSGTNAAPLYITTGVYVQTPQIYYGQHQLYYSPWRDCSSYKKLEYLNDTSVVVPVYCLKLVHQRSLPFDITLKIPVPTGGHFLIAQSMVVSGKWIKQDIQVTEDSTTSRLDLRMTTSHTINSNTQGTMDISKMATSDLQSSSVSLGLNKESTTTAQTSGTSLDKNSTIVPSTAYFSSPQYERTGNAIHTSDSDTVPAYPTSKQTPSQKKTTSHTDIVSSKLISETSKLPSPNNKCKSCTCVNITHHLTLNNVDISLKEIKSKLLLPQKNLSSYVRQKRSADDDRQSAADMGYVGLAVIIGCVSWVVSTDVAHVLYVIIGVVVRQLCRTSKKEQRK